MPHFSVPELLIIMVVILLLFGAKRIPEIAGSMGKGLKEFKKQMNDAQDEITGSRPYTPPRLSGDDLRYASHREDEEARPEPKRLIP